MSEPASTQSSIIQQALQKQADLQNPFSFREFSAIALFTPEAGYYTQNKERVGLKKETDFYTSTSMGSVFGKLVIDAARTLLPEIDLSQYTLVEIGCEPDQDAFADIQLPFAEKRNFAFGQPLDLPQKSVVFANELLDAQPFHRLIFKDGRWQELGVFFHPETHVCSEALLPAATEPIAALISALPDTMPEGYQLDLSLEAEQLLAEIAKQDWQGLLLCFDYGKTWDELLQACPQGTARAYVNHRQNTDILAHPGQQDLTADVCWDRLTETLRQHGFASPQVQRQESFFMHHSQNAIKTIIEQQPDQFDPERQTLLQLLHPSHMGHAFQVLWGIRL